MISISNPRELGLVIRAVRKAQGLRQDEIPGVSHKFIVETEAGKATVQLGKVLAVLRELGVHVTVDVPPGVAITLPERGA